MIDVSCEVFDYVSKNLRLVFPGITVIGESVDTPSRFPCVTIDEVRNVPSHLDSAKTVKYANVTYRVQVFASDEGKRAKARKIYAEVDRLLMDIGLVCKSYVPTPEVYHAQVYEIRASYKAIVDRNGVVYRG